MNKQQLGDRYYILLYEDLQRNPEQELKRVVEFLGVTYSQNMKQLIFLGKRQQDGASIDNKEDSSSIQNNSENRLKRFYKHTSRFERKIINTMIWQVAKEFNYNIESNNRIQGLEILFSALLKYKNPFDYISNRKDMLKQLNHHSYTVT